MKDEMVEIEEKRKTEGKRRKPVSMKRASLLFWHGLTALIVGVAQWLTAILGMKDDSLYCKILRRVVGTCFAIFMFLLAFASACSLCEILCSRFDLPLFDEDKNYEKELSPGISFYSIYGEKGYLKDAQGKKILKDILWIASPLGEDSLVCYSNGNKRGYFNKFTGKVVIEPKYNHAWIFSEGLAAVDDNGWIKFIDTSGKVVIDTHMPYLPGVYGYVFHNGYAIAHTDRVDRFGLIDKQGNWALQPEYAYMEYTGTHWIVDNGEGRCVMDRSLNQVIPYLKGRIWVYSDNISVTLDNHILQRYSLEGELINDFYISDITTMTYESDELRYLSVVHYNDDAEPTEEVKEASPYIVEKIARCRRYESDSDWYGLLSPEGKVVTPPSYCKITAIGYDLYLCEDTYGEGVILNGKGEMVR